MSTRIAVWGPGNVGIPAARTILAHPELELAGLIVHSEAKDGVDVGTLVGLPEVGLRATRDAEAVLASQPAALVYAANQDFRPAEAHDEMVAALERGITVVTAGTYALLHPATAPPELRARFEGACHEGASRFLSSGIDPGFAMDLLPLMLTGVCERIHEIRMIENFNYATYDVPPEVRAIIGFGLPMDQVPVMIMPGIPTSVWGGVLRALAAALELELTDVREVVERHPLERPVKVGEDVLAKGTLGAFRFEVQGIVEGSPLLVVEHITRIVDDTAPQWPKASGMGHHRVQVKGHPSVKLTFEAEGPGGDHVAGGNAAAAARIVHAIPELLSRPPGLYSGADLPLVVGKGVVRPAGR